MTARSGALPTSAEKCAWRSIDRKRPCYYSYYMKVTALKVSKIGNSRGVRIPADTLKRYGVGDTLIMEERADGILLRVSRAGADKLSWSETAAAMVRSSEDWSEWDATTADGLDDIPWDVARSLRVAQSSPDYVATATSKRKKRQ